MSDLISAADLSAIKSNIRALARDLEVVNGNVEAVYSSVNTVNSKVDVIYADFLNFVAIQQNANRKQIAHTELVKIRQELEQKYGHYETVRKTTTGILQANDLGILRKTTVTNVTEELMLLTPNYWLAPCLIGLSSWISDDKELAEKAVLEAIRRNDEKTSLFYALVCRRAKRKNASLKWTCRYLETQDEENLDRNAVIVLDAFASGILGVDSEGIVFKKIDEWMKKLSDKSGFEERQVERWTNAINSKKNDYSADNYPYLSRYSSDWGKLKSCMEISKLNVLLYEYFLDILNQDIKVKSIKEQLDEILTKLVSDFDNEELPLRKKEKLEEYVIKHDGNETKAKEDIKLEETNFREKKDFTQLLTDAAINPELSNASVSTQKFAIALTKKWILEAHRNILAENRLNYPSIINISFDQFSGVTAYGSDESRLVKEYNIHLDEKKQNAINSINSISIVILLVIGLVFLVIGIAAESIFGFFVIFLVMLAIAFFKYKKNEERKKDFENNYENERKRGLEIIRATLADAVDYRKEIEYEDEQEHLLEDLLSQVSSDQYVKKHESDTRKIKVSDM